MKELSIEQKAQRYDEALEKARQLCAYPTTKPFISDLQDIFTELAESEDEEIRKEMIDFTIKVNNGVTSILANNYDFNKWRAWLEKQDKKKPVQEIEPAPIFKIGNILKRKGKDYTFRVDRIQGGYYHCDRNYGAFFPIEEQGNWELVEQKSIEWSEEDEKMLSDIIKDLVHPWNEYIPDRIEDEIKWLKNRLKSLRPQNRWKPTKRQLLELSCAISGYSFDAHILEELEKDLKKLMEE